VNQLLLLSTSACHLCEQAEALLLQLDITYQKIDIAEQEQWQERYANKASACSHKWQAEVLKSNNWFTVLVFLNSPSEMRIAQK
jgi:arsenate reductase-like glutaredoxin family protein